jgi:CHRD domain
MKRLVLTFVGILLATGCSSNSSSSSPSNPNGPGVSTVRFAATLAPAQETPPIQNAESTGSGNSTMDFTITRDANSAISNATVNFQVNMSGFPASTVVTIAHIHTGATGVSGPILISTTVNPGEVVLSGGAGNFSRVAVPVKTTDMEAILANPAGFYFNVHTSLNPAGVMRGQLVKQ